MSKAEMLLRYKKKGNHKERKEERKINKIKWDKVLEHALCQLTS